MKKQTILSSILFLTLSVSLAMGFKPPVKSERERAIGALKGLPGTLRLAFDPGSDFEPIPVPKPGDWLAEHPEPGQRFDDFVISRPPRPDAVRYKIYLQPLGEFPEERSPSVETLRQYANASFGMAVDLLAPLDVGRSLFRTRLNPFSGNKQILTTDVLGFLKRRLPKDAYCALAISIEDLYPHPTWNFVFGQASFQDRVGVFSFARYDPAFYGEARGKGSYGLLLRRSCKVLAHETSHMLMLQHCIFFRCLMNGSNHLRESDARPLHLCPVCLRKLHFSIGFDVADRYERLLRFYQKVGFEDEAQWTAKRLSKIKNPP